MKNKNSLNTAFIGLSHLGLVTSIGWASLKQPVIGIDTDQNIINHLLRGETLIMEDGVELNEPGLPQLFQQVKRSYYPTTDFSKIEECNLVFFAKDTPKDIKNPEKTIFHLIEKSIPHLKDNATIVIMSQVPVGFCRETQNYLKTKRPDLSFSLYHWVDTIVMTDAIQRFLEPERIIIGCSDQKKPINNRMHTALEMFNCPILQVSFESAELTKAAINLYLATSVTFANTLSNLCEASGADINEIVPALKMDKRIGLYAYINPNLRIAGGHLERDLFMLKKLAKQNGILNSLIKLIINENEKRYLWAVNTLKKYLPKKAKVCIWGLAYKKNSSSTNNAASLKIITKLYKKYTLTAYDPMAQMPKDISGYLRSKNKYQALKNADCLLILTDWDEFSRASTNRIKKTMKKHLIIDCARALRSKKNKLGTFKYVELGVSNTVN